MTDTRRSCCCGPGGGVLFCASTAEWRDCTTEVCQPGNPTASDVRLRGDRFCVETFSEPSDWQVVRVSGVSTIRNDTLNVNFLDTYTEDRFEFDVVAGLIFQYGRPPSLADIIATYGTGHTVQGGGGSQFTGSDPNLYAGGFQIVRSRRITDSNGTINESDYNGPGFFTIQPSISLGGSGAVGLVTRAVPFAVAGCKEPASFTQDLGAFGSRDLLYTETFSGSADFVSESSRYESIATNATGGVSGTIADIQGSATLFVRDRLGTLGDHWEGPSDYDICENLGDPPDPGDDSGIIDVGDPEAGLVPGGESPADPNANTINRVMNRDPLRRCRGCGDPGGT